MSSKFFLGIDTSCYTTSIAAVDENYKLVYDGRKILSVKMGEKGLRQSDAFFQHIGNLSLLIEKCMKLVDSDSIAAITVSTRPRSVAGSYMPVFSAGFHFAKAIGSLLKLPVIEVSHQDSHIEAGIWSSGHVMKQEFMAYHISGGTTELLLVKEAPELDIEEIGGSSDLSAGQFIDRIGVALDMEFPCGQEMDRLCSEFETKGIIIPISIDGCSMSFSGPETHVQRLIRGKSHDKAEKSAISLGVFHCIAKSIEKTAINAKRLYGRSELLLIGGVASNTHIRNYLSESGKLKENGIEAVFSDPRYSPDNASGTAVLGMKRMKNGQ